MRICELSRLTGVHPETIRMYRKKGFLIPDRGSNGYYEYDTEDYISLIHLRKLRGFDLRLDSINRFYTSQSPSEVLDMLEEKKEETRKQIILLQERLRFLELESLHVRESREAEETSVLEIDSVDEKIDFYGAFGMPADVVRTSFSEIYSKTTPCIYIPAKVLNGPVRNEKVPLRAGVGTYRYIMEENGLKVPEKAVVIPHGRHISQMLSLEDHREISVRKLAPMMEYVQQTGGTFRSGTTGYLCGIDHVGGRRIYHYRIRACIQEKNRETREIR